ncbi:DUF2752 domain-containing protein [Thermostilla marina]
MGRRARCLIGGVAVGLVALFVIAAVLRPDPTGLGTHQQLGLPPCTFRVVFGARCPTCGMTTAWANLMHGRLAAALRANISGTVLAVLAAVCGVWLAVSAIRGSWWLVEPNDRWTAVISLVMAGCIMAEWLIRLWMESR